MAIDPFAEISRALEVAQGTLAETRAELDKATADYQRAVDDPPWATVHGTTIADLKTKVAGLTWRLGRDQAVVDTVAAILPPIHDGPVPVTESSPAPPLAKADDRPTTYSPPLMPGDPQPVQGEIQEVPSGADARFALNDVMQRMRQTVADKREARDGPPGIHAVAGDEPDDSPDAYDTLDASFKMQIALRDTVTSGELGKDVAEALKALLTPDAIAAFVAFTAVGIAAMLAGGPIGWFVGATGLVILYAALGQSFLDFWSILFNDVSKARNKRQYDLAVKKLARTISELGVTWLTTVLTLIGGHFVGKAIEGSGAGAGSDAALPSDGPAPGPSGPGSDGANMPKTKSLPKAEIPRPKPPVEQPAINIGDTNALPPKAPIEVGPPKAAGKPGPADGWGEPFNPIDDGGDPFNPIDDSPAPGDKTDAGRPNRAALDQAQHRAQQRAELRKAEEPFLNEDEEQNYNDAFASFGVDENDTIYGRRIVLDENGKPQLEDARVAARRYAKQHSIPANDNASRAAVNMKTARAQLEQLVTGRSETLHANENTVRTLYENYFREAFESARAAEGKYPDFWERMEPRDAVDLRAQLEFGEEHDLEYWLKRLEGLKAAQADGTFVADPPKGNPNLAKLVQRQGRAIPPVEDAPTNPSTHAMPAVNLGQTESLPAALVGRGIGGGVIDAIKGVLIALTLGVSFVGGLLLTGVGRQPTDLGSVGAASSQPSLSETSAPVSAAPTAAAIPSTRQVVVISGVEGGDYPVPDSCIDANTGNPVTSYHAEYVFQFLIANFGVGGTPSPDAVRRLVGRTVHVTLAGGGDAGTYTTQVVITNIGIQANIQGHPCTTPARTVTAFSVDGLQLVPAGDGYQADLP